MMRALPLLILGAGVTGCEREAAQPANVTTPVAQAEAPAPPAPEPLPPAPVEANAVAANAVQPADVAIAANAVPERFRGVYDRDEAGCRARSSVFRLRVSARELRFHESLGEVKSVSADGADAIRIASDYSGEGMEWSTSQRLSLADDGARLTVRGEGEPMTRVRC